MEQSAESVQALPHPSTQGVLTSCVYLPTTHTTFGFMYFCTLCNWLCKKNRQLKHWAQLQQTRFYRFSTRHPLNGIFNNSNSSLSRKREPSKIKAPDSWTGRIILTRPGQQRMQKLPPQTRPKTDSKLSVSTANKKGAFAPFIDPNQSGLITVMIRLVRSINRHVDICRLLCRQLGEFYADLRQMRTRDFFIQFFRQHIDFVFVRRSIGP